MALTGKLRTWHDDRGFGFIAPGDGGPELFVHISAFPHDGTRPTVGETLRYEVGPGQGGRPQALRVQRLAFAGHAPSPPRAPRPARPPHAAPARRGTPWLVGLVLAVAAGALAWQTLRPPAPAPDTPAPLHVPTVAPAPAIAPAAFRCDGRTHCSQMHSCAEARYFLAHCPGVQMDGNHDGVPCEQQWCTGPGAR